MQPVTYRLSPKPWTSVLTLSTGFHKNLSHPPSSEWFLKHGGAEACVRIVKQNVDTVEGLSSWDKDTLNAVQNAFVNGDVWLRRLVEIGALAQLDTFIEARSDYLAPCFTAINVHWLFWAYFLEFEGENVFL
eukprot:728463_1